MRNRIISCLALLSMLLLAGCAEMNSLRLIQDRPEDLSKLIEQKEFARARQLTGRYPSIDTLEIQKTISAGESEYEESVYSKAKELESRQDLLGAVTLLTDAVQRLPNSVLLRTLRNDLEQKRVVQVRVNERNMLLARAQYLIEQRELYLKQVKLQSPGFMQKLEHERQQEEAGEIAGRLVEHAGYAMQQSDNDTARNCLQVSLQLNPSDRASNLLATVLQQEADSQASERAATTRKEVRIKRVRKRLEKKETRQILQATKQAIDENKLQAAQAAIAKIPDSNTGDSDVIALQDTLDQAVTTRVRDLLLAGDAQYRAENIQPALKTWTEALSLDPDNTEIRKRIDRANKVLANLEELRRHQK